MTAALKLLHFLSLALWIGGLAALLLLCRQVSLRLRQAMAPDPADTPAHYAARLLYLTIASPAALLAIASGIGLIFLRDTHQPWFAAKLLLVALLVTLHVATGKILQHLFQEEESSASPRRTSLLLGALLVSSLGILFLVLARPQLTVAGLDGLFTPGRLREVITPAAAPRP